MKYEQIIARIALTNPQMRVIKRMEEGWLLCWSNEVSDKRCWLEGENGEKYTVHVPTIRALEKLDIIKQDNAVPIGTFHFVE